MNLLKCTDWKVFFFRKPPKGEKEAKEKVDEEKEEKVTSKKEVLSFSSVLECPSRCSGSALVSKSV